jgi:adenine-specific DNA-methyltransferase
MNYIGSKLKLIPFIKSTIHSVCGKDLSKKIFCDLFAGTGIVGRAFKAEVKQVISNDYEYYSFILNKNYIENHQSIKYQKFLNELNTLPPINNGFIYENYSLGSKFGRLYFSGNNGKKIDAVRQKIECWKENKKINSNLYYFLLCSLLEAVDKVANTASVYGAFLKHLKKSAQKDLFLEPALFTINDNQHKAYSEDSNELIQKISGDILYLDPPYNTRQYGANYHLLNTVAKYDNFVPKGKTGLRDYKRSKYCVKKYAAQELNALLKNAKFKYIFLSYNNEGLMSANEIKTIMLTYGKYYVMEKKYQRFKADKTENRNHKASSTKEYLHILEKS